MYRVAYTYNVLTRGLGLLRPLIAPMIRPHFHGYLHINLTSEVACSSISTYTNIWIQNGSCVGCIPLLMSIVIVRLRRRLLLLHVIILFLIYIYLYLHGYFGFYVYGFLYFSLTCLVRVLSTSTTIATSMDITTLFRY